MNELHQTTGISAIGKREMRLACAAPREPLRSLSLAMVSHQTLLRSTGSLGMFDLDPKGAAAKQRAGYQLRQTAIITAGLMLGIVFRNAKGEFEVR